MTVVLGLSASATTLPIVIQIPTFDQWQVQVPNPDNLHEEPSPLYSRFWFFYRKFISNPIGKPKGNVTLLTGQRRHRPINGLLLWHSRAISDAFPPHIVVPWLYMPGLRSIMAWLPRRVASRTSPTSVTRRKFDGAERSFIDTATCDNHFRVLSHQIASLYSRWSVSQAELRQRVRRVRMVQ